MHLSNIFDDGEIVLFEIPVNVVEVYPDE